MLEIADGGGADWESSVATPWMDGEANGHGMGKKRASTKAERRRVLKKRSRDREDLLDLAVGSVRYAVGGPGLCLPSCVLLQRVLAGFMPSETFAIRLGALTVHAENSEAGSIAFDPRTPDGIDGGFHVWLEDGTGKVIDPSIAVTLHHEGYDVDPQTYFLGGSRRFERFGLQFVYEEVPELEMIGVEESDPQLDHLLRMALTGEPAPPGIVHLDVRWRSDALRGRP